MIEALVDKLVNNIHKPIVKDVRFKNDAESYHVVVDNLNLCVIIDHSKTAVFWIFEDGLIASYNAVMAFEKMKINDALVKIKNDICNMKGLVA